MSPCGIGGASFFSSGMSVTNASVVSRSEAMDAAFSSATRSTFAGSMMPACSMSTNSMVSASKPRVATVSALTFSTITLPSRPAFSTIWRMGSSSARLTIMAPTFSSPSAFTRSMALDARSSATPPPGTMPSSTAARVAFSASSTRAFFSFIADQGRQRLALDVLGDDEEGLAGSGDLLQQREHVLHHADLLLVDEDEGVLEHDLHSLGVCHEVRREVAAVELHALDQIQNRVSGL